MNISSSTDLIKTWGKLGRKFECSLKYQSFLYKERRSARPVWLSVLPPKLCTSHIWPCQSPSAMTGERSVPCPWEVPERETNRRAEHTREDEVKLHLKPRALLERNLRPETSTHLHGGTGIIQGESDLSLLWEKKWGFSFCLREQITKENLEKKAISSCYFLYLKVCPLRSHLKTSNIKGSLFFKGILLTISLYF